MQDSLNMIIFMGLNFKGQIRKDYLLESLS